MGVEVPSNPINRKEQYLAKIAGQAVEIPAEPITREEAYLDEIAKNGSGGGGTTNYNNLSNQPQINNNTLIGNKSASDLGLVAAEEGKGLSKNDYTDADKAKVEAAKNEFVGTLAEWEALSPAQQKAFDTYQITNDFDPSEIAIPTASASKLGGIKVGDGLSIDANGVLSAEASSEWSTNEHEVGTWIDGSKVYEKTVQVTLGGSSDTDRLLISGLAPTRAWIVDSDFVYNTGAEQLHFYLGCRVNGVMTTGFLINKSGGLYVRINNNYAGVDGLSGYVTIRYVKPTV